MSDNNVEFRKLIYRDSSDALNEYADEFAYSSYGEADSRVGSIAFFKQVSDWVSANEIQPTRYQIANIRMSEKNLLELAHFILSQHELSKKSLDEE
ncbi:hypothetical protein [Enterobacter hormaechei]|uniref:hypothetical protein n=1 Tax=Enterobacter hormaechei TaxID=158836 RepID=UPI00254FA9E4|nr:hypothetical protein [Enterobacter hormaechei]MDK9957315.1 hypothetical protein [Enterobacter hormaechei]